MVSFGCTTGIYVCIRAGLVSGVGGVDFIASELTLIVIPIKKRCGKGMPPLSRWPIDHTMHP